VFLKVHQEWGVSVGWLLVLGIHPSVEVAGLYSHRW